VHAAGDGRVSFAGPRGGYGNAVVLAHGSSVSTLYGHMSRFARQLRVGTSIKQGDVIGYVGMTGLATGPHLHYEYIVNGAHKNPQTVHLKGAEPLRAETLQRFRDATAPLLIAASVCAPLFALWVAADYRRVLPFINYENRQCGLRAAKALMLAGGVIQSDFVRHPLRPLHPATRAGLLELAEELQPLALRWGR